MIEFLSLIKTNSEKDKYKWLFALKTILVTLDNFGLSLKDKFEFVKMNHKNFENAINIDKVNRKKISKKYRENSRDITSFITTPNIESFEIYDCSELIESWSSRNLSIVENVKFNLEKEGISLDEYLSDIIHMHVNRLFRYNQKLMEFMLYSFLSKYLNTQIEREKK